MRNLKGNDIFTVSRMLKKIDIKFEIKKGMSQEELGGLLIKQLFENIHLVQDEFNDFLGSLCGISGEEVGNLDLNMYLDKINQLKEKIAGTNFLQNAMRLMK